MIPVRQQHHRACARNPARQAADHVGGLDPVGPLRDARLQNRVIGDQAKAIGMPLRIRADRVAQAGACLRGEKQHGRAGGIAPQPPAPARDQPGGLLIFLGRLRGDDKRLGRCSLEFGEQSRKLGRRHPHCAIDQRARLQFFEAGIEAHDRHVGKVGIVPAGIDRDQPLRKRHAARAPRGRSRACPRFFRRLAADEGEILRPVALARTGLQADFGIALDQPALRLRLPLAAGIAATEIIGGKRADILRQPRLDHVERVAGLRRGHGCAGGERKRRRTHGNGARKGDHDLVAPNLMT